MLVFGNWLETVATFYQRRTVDRQLFKALQIEMRLRDFRDRIKVLDDPFPSMLDTYWSSLKDFIP